MVETSNISSIAVTETRKAFPHEEHVEAISRLVRKYPCAIELVPILEDMKALLELKNAGRLDDASSHDMKQFVHYALKRFYKHIRKPLGTSPSSNPEENLG